jgi:hypothetical protein
LSSKPILIAARFLAQIDQSISGDNTKGVHNPIGIQWLDRKWNGWTLRKLYSGIRLIFERAEAEGEEGSYEDHLSCLEELQE